jgi:hypothetical protein
MPCPKCGNGPTNKYCPACLRDIDIGIQGSRTQILNMAVMFAGVGEQNYLSDRVVYTDSATAKQVQGGKNGHADGFNALQKTFTLQQGVSPSVAVKSFIMPANVTVCECRGFISGVYCNGVRIVLNKLAPLLFDHVFPGLSISCDDNDSCMEFLNRKKITKNDIDSITMGDWIWIPNPNTQYREFTGGKLASGAASGWNLLCVKTYPEKLFIGFGLSHGPHVQAQTLEKILEHLNNEASRNNSSGVVYDKVEEKKMRRGSMELPKRGGLSLVEKADLSSYPWKLYTLNTAKLARLVQQRLNIVNQTL